MQSGNGWEHEVHFVTVEIDILVIHGVMSDDISCYFAEIKPHPLSLLVVIPPVILLVIKPNFSLSKSCRDDAVDFPLIRLCLLKSHAFFLLFWRVLN